jgi:endonuclease/exonuclease/phosphatase (EEP) superfamily protein YafD
MKRQFDSWGGFSDLWWLLHLLLLPLWWCKSQIIFASQLVLAGKFHSHNFVCLSWALKKLKTQFT